MTFQIVDYDAADAVQQGHVKSGISSVYPLIDYQRRASFLSTWDLWIS